MKIAHTTAGVGVVEGERLFVRWANDRDFFAGEECDVIEVALADVEILAPSTRPEKIVCVGLNYRRHAAESKLEIPEFPVLFPKFANSITADAAQVSASYTEQLDYEVELAVVIGSTCTDVTTADALDHVAGYTCANDLSARDLQFLTSQWMSGKAIDGYLPLGPYLVTPDEVDDPQDLGLRCWVNGDLRQDDTTADMIFSVAEIISFVSRTCTLVPGDVIITGTPAGVGMGFEPPAWLVAGDEVVVEIDRIGMLTTTIT